MDRGLNKYLSIYCLKRLFFPHPFAFFRIWSQELRHCCSKCHHVGCCCCCCLSWAWLKMLCFYNSLSRVWLKMLCFSNSLSRVWLKMPCFVQFPFPGAIKNAVVFHFPFPGVIENAVFFQFLFFSVCEVLCFSSSLSLSQFPSQFPSRIPYVFPRKVRCRLFSFKQYKSLWLVGNETIQKVRNLRSWRHIFKSVDREKIIWLPSPWRFLKHVLSLGSTKQGTISTCHRSVSRHFWEEHGFAPPERLECRVPKGIHQQLQAWSPTQNMTLLKDTIHRSASDVCCLCAL